VRDDLAQLRAAGQTRARFSARVSKVTERGIVVLEDVFSPIGVSSHAYIRAGQWRGRLPRSGDQVEVLASVEPYFRNDGSQDLGLFHCVVVP